MTEPHPHPHPHHDASKNIWPPGQVKTLILYAAFIAAIVFQMIPVMELQILSIVLLLGCVVAIGIFRRDSPADSLLNNHATYLSRSFWMWSILMSLGGAIGGYLLFTQHDLQSLMNIARDLSDNQEKSEAFKMMSLYAAASFGPGLVYLAYRIIKGLHRALYGYRLAKPKSWF